MVSTYYSTSITLEPSKALFLQITNKNAETVLVIESGSAEVFGVPMEVKKIYKFGAGTKLSIFSFEGCVVTLSGFRPDDMNIYEASGMIKYRECHADLEAAREEAAANSKHGPIVFVVGPKDVGKTTLTRTLLNYALRDGRQIYYSNIDVGQGTISMPGSIASLLLQQPQSLGTDFSEVETMMAYHYGHTGISANPDLYRQVISAMGNNVLKILQDPEQNQAKSAGIIIDTNHWVKKPGYAIVLHAARAFQVTHILVIDDEHLFDQLKKDLPATTNMMMLPKNDGRMVRNKFQRELFCQSGIQNYFYGLSAKPFKVQLKFNELKLYKTVNAPRNPVKLVVIKPIATMVRCILSVKLAGNIEEIIKQPVIGFVCITRINPEQQTMTLLSRMPQLPSDPILQLTNIQLEN